MSDEKEVRMPRVVKAGLEYMPRRMAVAGDARRLRVIRATETVPEGLGAGDLLAVWFHKDLKDSTVMLRSVRLVEASARDRFGLAFIGIPRSRIPRGLGDGVEMFVN